jgi:hypothetical protein
MGEAGWKGLSREAQKALKEQATGDRLTASSLFERYCLRRDVMLFWIVVDLDIPSSHPGEFL